jgi:hypothetical protein
MGAGASDMSSKTTKFLFIFFTFALAGAIAASHTVTLFQPSLVAGKELKPGEYKLTLENNKVTIEKGKQKVEVEVKVESSDTKFSSTSVRYTTEAGVMKVQEIRLGGTTTRLVFN